MLMLIVNFSSRKSSVVSAHVGKSLARLFVVWSTLIRSLVEKIIIYLGLHLTQSFHSNSKITFSLMNKLFIEVSMHTHIRVFGWCELHVYFGLLTSDWNLSAFHVRFLKHHSTITTSRRFKWVIQKWVKPLACLPWRLNTSSPSVWPTQDCWSWRSWVWFTCSFIDGSFYVDNGLHSAPNSASRSLSV